MRPTPLPLVIPHIIFGEFAGPKVRKKVAGRWCAENQDCEGTNRPFNQESGLQEHEGEKAKRGQIDHHCKNRYDSFSYHYSCSTNG